MAKELMLFEKPALPADWNYDNSVKSMKQTIYKWKNITEDVATELWVARETLSAQGQRSDLTSEQTHRSWSQYCADIGIAKSTANRWLVSWFPKERKRIQKSELKQVLEYGCELIHGDFSTTATL